MNRQIEREAKEGDDDQVNQSDGDGGCGDRWIEGTEIEHGEADCGVEGLRGPLEGCARDGGVGEDLGRPLRAEHGCDLRLEHAELGQDVVVVGRVVARGLVNDLACAQGVEGEIPLLDRLLQEGCGVGVHDDGGPGFPVVYCAPDVQGVVVKCGRRNSDEAEMRLGVGGDDALRYFCDHWANERGGLGFEIDNVDDEGVEVHFYMEQDAPVKGEYP